MRWWWLVHGLVLGLPALVKAWLCYRCLLRLVQQWPLRYCPQVARWRRRLGQAVGWGWLAGLSGLALQVVASAPHAAWLWWLKGMSAGWAGLALTGALLWTRRFASDEALLEHIVRHPVRWLLALGSAGVGLALDVLLDGLLWLGF